MKEIRMRPSRILNKLRKGEVVISCKANLSCPRIMEIIAFAGFDSVWLDMEHVPNSWAAVEAQVYAAKAGGIDSIVRVSKGSYSPITKPLEMDASGIMVPHIMSADEARKTARMTRFHPIGMRPADGGNADAAFTMLPLADYMEQANRERVVIIQIEDIEPLDELDEICSVEGIDMIFFGPGDFSQSIGAPGRLDHPRVVDTRKKIAETARKHGKFAGTVGTKNNFQELVDMGYQFVNLGSDVGGLKFFFNDIVNSVRPM